MFVCSGAFPHNEGGCSMKFSSRSGRTRHIQRIHAEEMRRHILRSDVPNIPDQPDDHLHDEHYQVVVPADAIPFADIEPLDNTADDFVHVESNQDGHQDHGASDSRDGTEEISPLRRSPPSKKSRTYSARLTFDEETEVSDQFGTFVNLHDTGGFSDDEQSVDVVLGSTKYQDEKLYEDMPCVAPRAAGYSRDPVDTHVNGVPREYHPGIGEEEPDPFSPSEDETIGDYPESSIRNLAPPDSPKEGDNDTFVGGEYPTGSVAHFRHHFNTKGNPGPILSENGRSRFLPGDGLDGLIGGTGPYGRENLADFFTHHLGAPKSTHPDYVNYPALDPSLPTLPHTSRTKHYLLLLDLLDQIDAPRYMFREVLDWCKSAHHDCFDFGADHPSRQSFEAFMSDTIPIPPPREMPVRHFGRSPADLSLRIIPEMSSAICCDVASQFFVMVNDPELMQPHKLLWNDVDDPYLDYVAAPVCDEIQDGRVFQQCIKLNAAEEAAARQAGVWAGSRYAHFNVAWVEFCDRTHLDLMGHITGEPVVMVPTFVKREYRHDPRYWIIAGYVPQCERKSGSTRANEEKGTSVRNFQNCLMQIHQQFRIFMATGLPMKCRFAGVEDVRNVKFFYVNATADGQGSDKASARFDSKHLNLNRIHWKCMCPTKHADLVLYPGYTDEGKRQLEAGLLTDDVMQHITGSDGYRCRFVEREHLRSLVDTALDPGSTEEEVMEAKEKLDGLSQHCVDIAYDKLWVADPKHGIHGMACTCILHGINGGIVHKVTDTELLRMTAPLKSIVDAMQQRFFNTYKQAELSRTYSRTSFSQLTNISKVTMTERMGVLLCLTIIMRTGLGIALLTSHVQKRDDKVTEAAEEIEELKDDSGKTYSRLEFEDYPALQNYAYCNEMILCCERWCAMPGAHLPDTGGDDADGLEDRIWQCEYAFRRLLDVVVTTNKRVIVRADVKGGAKVCGNGWKIPKAHQLLHIPREVAMYGLPANFSTHFGEKNHITFVKKPGKTSQKRTQKEFGRQVARRNHHRAVMRVFAQRCGIDLMTANNRNVSMHPTDQGTKSFVYFFDADPPPDGQQRQQYMKTMAWSWQKVETFTTSSHHFEIPAIALEILRELYGNADIKRIGLSTEYKRAPVGDKPEFVVRAHPNYRGGGKRWNDWFRVIPMSAANFNALQTWMPEDEQVPVSQLERMQREGTLPPVVMQALAFVTSEQDKVHPEKDIRCSKVLARVAWPFSKEHDTLRNSPAFRPGNDHGFTWDECDGDLMVRYRKTYGQKEPGGRRAPHIVLLPTSFIEDPIFVVEDFPYLFDDFAVFEEERKKIAGEFDRIIVEKRRLRHDFVYAVKPLNLWPSKFCGDGPADPWKME